MTRLDIHLVHRWIVFFFRNGNYEVVKTLDQKGVTLTNYWVILCIYINRILLLYLQQFVLKKKWGHQDIYRISIQWGDNLRKITIHLRFLMTQCSICRLLIFYDNSISVSLFWIADLLRVKPEQSEAAVCIKQAVGFLHLLVSWSRLSVYPSVYISFIRLSFLVITLIYYNNLSIS